MTTSANHEITIALQGDNAMPPNPLPEMHVGETVRYSSPAGKVRILFPDRSPFRTDNETMTNIPDSVILPLLSDTGDGTLPCRCFIRLPDGKEVGWDEDHPLSGGDHKVTKP